MVQQKSKPKTRRKVNAKYVAKKTTAELVPLTENQGLLIEALGTHNQIIAMGPAGTGKTWVVSTHAFNQYTLGLIDKIVITRPHVGVDNNKIGTLPGDEKEKIHPWAFPVLDVFREHMETGEYESAINNNNIEVAPLALMRGRTFKNAFIIVDEAQNLTVPEVKALLTRVGENSTIVLNGDPSQMDIKGANGIEKVLHLAKKHMLPVAAVEFTMDDIVRSDTCKMWVEIFTKENI